MNDKTEHQPNDPSGNGRDLLTQTDNLSTADLARGARPAERDGGGHAEGSTADRMPLLSAEESGKLRSSWDSIQTSFVDEPRTAVAQADHLVAGAIKRLAEVFAAERSKLEHQWEQGDDVSTEELRMTLRRYRSFFQRVVSV